MSGSSPEHIPPVGAANADTAGVQALPVPTDPVAVAQALIRHPSVCPDPGPAQQMLAVMLAELGFDVWHLPYGEGAERTPNLFARWGKTGPHICFAGHTDVVPPGNEAAWTHPPYAAEIDGGVLYGRGACDMKGGIAAFVAAVARFVRKGPHSGAISFLITGDEEGPATYGTKKVLEWMAQEGQIPDYCIVGEPTNPTAMGDMVKIGRRGSLNAHIVVEGVQGHVAYPHRADNPVHRLLTILAALQAHPLDNGSDWFEPSSLQVTSVDVGNPSTNVIPARAEARLNIRFNDLHTGAGLTGWLRTLCRQHAPNARVEVKISGESFLTAPGAATDALVKAIEHVTQRTPKLDTGGGTSDARFIAQYCPVSEFGLVGASIHKVDEHTSVADLETLTQIYETFLEGVMA
ncbi:succinyl-diaminopimelate desuccinylase [Acetobacter senegalensis]|uniref:Succinyl-diaminopimelate desuccinylase n=1 Tax=Acetobacter tropicalis NBRC 101654 TaxID=749388 RepID=F7VI96_9PROT|nr:MULTISPECIES: succinyl-diaminopimelate desuccinylase [Acetobacter]MCG4253376.1 succinyl-diaminopimelate desuccinylase [Acetobacter senegalensis]GAA10091.1 acetylornithine deacetylase [Acetobacter tropicalis NBRC 101654]